MQATSVAPSLHVGWARGPSSADLVFARSAPQKRGSRASLLAQARRLSAYVPVVRHTPMVGQGPVAALRLKAGRETQGAQHASFFAAGRLLIIGGSRGLQVGAAAGGDKSPPLLHRSFRCITSLM